MRDWTKLIKWMFALVVVAFIQQKSANIFGGTLTDLFPSVDLRSLPLAGKLIVGFLLMDSAKLWNYVYVTLKMLCFLVLSSVCNIIIRLGYLRDRDAAAHSVVSDIF